MGASTAPDARTIVESLGGRMRGESGTCRCPAHADSSPSLSVTRASSGTVLVHCFTGCPQGEVISALRGLDLWPGEGEYRTPKSRDPAVMEKIRREEKVRVERARDVWIKANKFDMRCAYLEGRGITILPPTVRWSVLKHPTSAVPMPALVFPIQSSAGDVTAVQRIFLDPDGVRKTDTKPAKATLGVMDDGAVRFGASHSDVGLAEGPETALSAQQLFGVSTWCSCGAGRMKRVVFPAVVRTVHIFADAGEAGARAAEDAEKVFKSQGRKVVIRSPKAGDWNDVLRGEA